MNIKNLLKKLKKRRKRSNFFVKHAINNHVLVKKVKNYRKMTVIIKNRIIFA
jgi:hypothetical protein